MNRGLPAPLLVKHFTQVPGGDWVASEALRGRMRPLRMNLASPWPTLPAMDVLLIRNVLIYFDVPTRRAVLDQAHRLLRPNGVLLLGSAETTAGIHEGFKRGGAGGASFFRPA